MIAILIALFIHEAGHIIGIYLTGAGKVTGFVVSLKGVGVKWEPYGNDSFKRMIVTFSGVGANFIMALAAYLLGYEFIGFVSLIFGLVNLIPFPHSDGSRVIKYVKELA